MASQDEERAAIRDRALQSFVQQSHYDPMADAFDVGWDSAMEYVRSVDRLSPEHKTMRVLLEYPNPIGLHENEARWRDFARALLK